MKKTMNRALSIVLMLAFVATLVACNPAGVTEETGTSTETESVTVMETEAPKTAESEEASEPTAQTEAQTEAETEAQKEIAPEGLWQNATYRTDKEFGTGAKTVIVEVKAGDQFVTFTVKTDKDTVGAALLEHSLLAGDDGAYGLYVKTVNGILADYDVDRSYWAFYIDGEYAMTGVDSTAITEGVTYRLEYTK